MACKMVIDMPSESGRQITRFRSISVLGRIISDEPLKNDTEFRCELRDSVGRLVRYTESHIKDDRNVDLYRDDLTVYPEEIDPGREKLKAFGFVEILKNGQSACNKAFYNDYKFRSIIYCASDRKHGAIFDDGMNWTDEDGEAYRAFSEGEYSIRVSLSSAEGELICEDSINIIVAAFDKTMICRFYPMEHRLKMYDFADRMGLSIVKDDLPGYLIPYHNDLWLYHMGLLKFYRANDIALYVEGQVHMIVYMIADDSTSLRTELAYLEANGEVDNPDRFKAYCYDIGEALVGEGRAFEREGRIIDFGDEYLHIYRMDIVDSEAAENVYDLKGRHQLDVMYEDFTCRAGQRIAITGAIRPFQQDREDFILRDDNTYDIRSKMDKIIYRFESDGESRVIEKSVNMTRYEDAPLEDSVYEFYNIFDIDESMAGREWKVSLEVYDTASRPTPCNCNISLKVI